MKVLLLGATGNVGSRMLRALLAHKHTPILYLRNAKKLPQDVLDQLNSTQIVTGSATDSQAITRTILDHDCDAVFSAVGLAAMISRSQGFPAIFKAVVDAIASAGQQKGKPVRAWLMSGWSSLDIPERITGKRGVQIISYLPLYPDHLTNLAYLRTLSTEHIAWSLLNSSDMSPSKEPSPTEHAMVNSSKIISQPDSPPEWSSTLSWMPLLGTWLNLLANASRYPSTLEQAVEVAARDFEEGLSSPLIGHRVGFIVGK